MSDDSAITNEQVEQVEFRGVRWFVADARWDQSDLEGGAGSHWHLTLTGPLPEMKKPRRARVGRSRGRKGEKGWRQQ